MKTTAIKIIFTTFVLMLSIMFFAKEVKALCDPHRVGPKLGNRTDFLGGGVYPDNFIRTKYNDHNSSCPDDPVVVTVLYTFAGVAEGMSTQQGRDIQNTLNRMHSQNLIPIIRLYTNYTGSGFTTITESEASAAAQGLNEIIGGSAWQTNEIIVYPGNEVNSPAEWPNPAEGLDEANQIARVQDFGRIFAAFANAANNSYRVYLPPLNAYLGVCEVDEGPYDSVFNAMKTAAGSSADGAAFTVYNDPVSNITSDIARMASVAGMPYIISEVGPKVTNSDGCPLLDQAEDVDLWKEKMTAVFKAEYNNRGSVFGNAEKATTSFFLNCDNQLTSFLVVIGEQGDVTIEEEDQIDCNSLITGQRPIDFGFYANRYPCVPGEAGIVDDIDGNGVLDDEFHPLRPYPASSCEPLIPQSVPEAPYLLMEKPSGSQNIVRAHKYINYACGTSIDFTGTTSFNPFGYSAGATGYGQLDYGAVSSVVGAGTTYAETVCEPENYSCTVDQYNSGSCAPLTCYRTVRYEVEVDFRDSNLGLLGNTQKRFADKELVNNYLSWYFTGTTIAPDYAPLDKNNPEDIHKLINFSGPVRKLMPFDAQIFIKNTIATAQPNDINQSDVDDIHDYIVGCRKDIDDDYIRTNIENILQLIKDSAGFLWDALVFADAIMSIGKENFYELGVALIELALDPNAMVSPEAIRDFINDPDRSADWDIGLNFAKILYDSGVVVIGQIATILRDMSLDMAESCTTSAEIRRLSDFGNAHYPGLGDNLPPDPRYYSDFAHFWEDYNNWRGLTDLYFFGPSNIPNPFVNQNVWAQLFQNVPVTGLEDIPGEGFHTGYGQGVGPFVGTDGRFTASPQFNIVEAEQAMP